MADANPWNHPFRPTGYEVNWEVFGKLPLAVRRSQNLEQMTVGAVIAWLLPDRGTDDYAARRVTVGSEGFGCKTIRKDDITVTLESIATGTGFAAELLAIILEFGSRGIQHPIFFFFDEDYVTDDLHFSYRFFVINGDQIVADHISLPRTSNNGFRPDALTAAFDEEDPIWISSPGIGRAQVRSWYQKFYEETQAGRLTVLRDDVELYHYVPPWKVPAQSLQVAERIASELTRLRWLVAGCLVVLLLSLFHVVR